MDLGAPVFPVASATLEPLLNKWGLLFRLPFFAHHGSGLPWSALQSVSWSGSAIRQPEFPRVRLPGVSQILAREELPGGREYGEQPEHGDLHLWSILLQIFENLKCSSINHPAGGLHFSVPGSTSGAGREVVLEADLLADPRLSPFIYNVSR